MSDSNLAKCTVAVSDTQRERPVLDVKSMYMVPDRASDSRKGRMLMGVAPFRVMWDHRV